MNGCELLNCSDYKNGVCHYDSDVCKFNEEDNQLKHKLDDLGEECFNHFKELNPKGGIKEFIKLAVAFGYRKAMELNQLKNN